MRELRTPEKAGRLTTTRATAIPAPERGYTLHWCPQTKGFGVRVTASGARSWVSERRVNGKTVRRTLGKVEGRGAVSAEAARGLMIEVSGELQRGVDRMQEQRAERAERKKADADDAATFEKALHQYVEKKRRGKDGLALKERTRADYLAMVQPARAFKAHGDDGRQSLAGELFELADKPLARITADNVRAVFNTAKKRGARRATYAMQVLRAVLNWHGVSVPGNPLGKGVAGKDRIVLGKTTGDPKPIPPEQLPAWWNAATALAGRESADYYRLLLLTGARPGEIAALKVGDVDLAGARIVLHDTKNRSDHVLLLSQQAAAIVGRLVNGKRASAKLFAVGDARKTLKAIDAAAGTRTTAKSMRSTFASVAEELVSAYTLKRMLNHAQTGDVTGQHYVGKSEAQLRAGWQAVGDFVAGRPIT